jgi:hypothetical protein
LNLCAQDDFIITLEHEGQKFFLFKPFPPYHVSDCPVDVETFYKLLKEGIKMDMTVTLHVEGKEGLNLELKYTNTDMPTVLLVEKTLIDAFSGLLTAQANGKL